MATGPVVVCSSKGEPSEDAQIRGRPTNAGTIDISNFRSWKSVRILSRSTASTCLHEAIASNGSRFAVKVAQLSLIFLEGIIDIEQRRSELCNEISILECTEHENIVEYWGCKTTKNQTCIFYELFGQGFTVRYLIELEILEDSKIPDYTRQILKALEYLHEKNIVHRNLRCQNVLVNETGKIKLTGFKFADKIEDDISRPKGIGILESSYWMAPEIIKPEGRPYGTATDIWYLGCTVLEMTTRNFPFPDLSWFHALYAIEDGKIPTIPESVPEDARDFIERCLQQNPADRATASELLKHPFVGCFSG